MFLGAGASISSGIPSAAACIWEWKRSIFLTKNPGLESQFSELSLPSVKDRIQAWLDAQRTFPDADAPNEYGFYINACYPRQDDRRAFFATYLAQAQPHTGYQILALMARVGTISSVWTTNFDALPARAAAGANVSTIEVGIDSQGRLDRLPRAGELLSVALHGDYRYDNLKSEPQEIQNQEKYLLDAMATTFTRAPVIVCGCSGRDAAIMDALAKILSADSAAPFYWCNYSDEPPSSEVANLLEIADPNRARSAYVPGVGFDDLMRRLALHCLDGDHAMNAKAILAKAQQAEAKHTTAFSLPDLAPTGLIKSNAFRVTPPHEMLQFDLHQWPNEKVWAHLEEIGDKHGFVAAPLRGKVFAFATPALLRDAFGANLKDPIDRVPVGKDDLRYEDTVTITLIRRALVRAAAARAGMPSKGALIWSPDARKHGHNGITYLTHDAVVLFVRPYSEGLQLVLMPTLHLTLQDGSPVPIEHSREIKSAILGYQHNAEFNDAVEQWRQRFLPKDSEDFQYPAGQEGFRFRVSRAPFVGAITDEREDTVPLNDRAKRLVSYRGLQIKEPALLFASAQQKKIARDIHPVRGLLANRPYDIELSTRGMTGPIRIGVVCPGKDRAILSSYLQLLNRPIDPGSREQDYLPPFPGFPEAFRTSLSLSIPGDPAWFECPEPDPALDEQQGARELGRQVATAVTQIKAAQIVNVVVIYIPERWRKWRVFSTEDESFNLHDFVKAAAIPLGIATQFLEADTLENELQCRIRWWLSLAFYVKSMRTPWVLSGLQQDTGYVGLAFGMAQQNRDQGNIVLGCSHLYNAQGEGLQFRLSKIENPMFLGRNRRNPYMSFDDARRLGETIRQQFFEARMRLPKRVVVHKLTPFLQQEQDGLRAGLEDVPNIELIQIFTDDALRYVASVYKDEVFAPDGFPIRRGTTLLQDEQSALLWVHGASTALNPRLKYYQGKRRIPAPMVIRRFSGHADLVDVAGEILGLSKMNWNSFDLYAQVPATIESSRQVARIGSLLTRFGASYDYRLFM
ncbi:MAG: SIR2 family protein [Burkholderiales bacterium]